MQIRNLFDSQRDIERQIEKVISYGAAQEDRLKAEISEYVVTEKIESQLEKLLTDMQRAMDSGGQNEVGVWVSGFYGSGKSSFTKYLALALDDRVMIDGVPFLKHFQDRLHKDRTKALLVAVAQRFPAAVVMLDLATEAVAGASLVEVTTVLYYKVLQWAGYSKNTKVAALERKLKKEGRYEEFEQAFEVKSGAPWCDYQDDQLVVDSLLPAIAHELYPDLFQSAESFRTSGDDVVSLLKDRMQEIINIVRDHSARECIIFVIDEVGQYVGSNTDKILDLQGMAENLKNIGEGKVWVIGTAQQTLTEDDPRAALNSPELFKVKDRFPISVAMESSDIKEICYRRLLAKSPSGKDELEKLFDQHGQALRHNTKLEDARFYDSEFGKEDFTNLYPFLPAHFDILLHLLGALAKSTGGVGLRSAIKVIQDVLIEPQDDQDPVADQPVGWLATTVTLYDSLEKDIRRAFVSIHQSIDKVLLRFPDSPLHQNVAKTIGVLQILNNLPVTVTNVAALMHAGVSEGSQAAAVKTAVDELLADAIVPLGEKDSTLSFFSEKLNDIEQERANLPLRTPDLRRINNEALREIFNPLPKTSVAGSLTVTSGIKVQTGGGAPTSLAGERDTLQTIIELVDAAEYDTKRNELVEESRQRSSQYMIYLLGRRVAAADEQVAEIYRCQRIVDNHRGDPDQEIREYCNSQTDRAARLSQELAQNLRRSLRQGSFVFAGAVNAVDSLDSELLAASKKQLVTAAEQAFDKYAHAPHRAETGLAEKFLRKASNLSSITGQLDPLGLVTLAGGTPSIDTNHQALVDIRDYIERFGTSDGKRLLDYFADAPFGWSQDTLRYLVAALLVAGEIKLRVSGREFTVTGQQAIDALKTNNAFKNVGVALRDDRPSMEVVARAAKRLIELTGEDVIPLEPEISKAASKQLPRIQQQLGPFAERLKQLALPGAERIGTINQDITDLLQTDASDAAQRFGGEESPLAEGLGWALEAQRAMEQGLEQTVRSLRKHSDALGALPTTGIPGELYTNTTDDLADIDERLQRDDFYQHSADFNTALTGLETQVSGTVQQLRDAQRQRLQQAEQDLARIPEWQEFTEEEQRNTLDELSATPVEVDDDLVGLQRLITHDYELGQRIDALKQRVIAEGQKRQRQRVEEKQRKEQKEGQSQKATRTAVLPGAVTSLTELEALIQQLQALRAELRYYEEFELKFTANDSPKDQPEE
ncbi:BREX system P-loop protein BrxC [Gammaproteobacteria bacterium]|nr:BREX system P-loop protein BrxC [Gammaproteobacteria bacterium]